MFFNKPIAEKAISANSFEWYKKVFAPTTPAFIVDEQVCGNPLNTHCCALPDMICRIFCPYSLDIPLSALK